MAVMREQKKDEIQEENKKLDYLYLILAVTLGVAEYYGMAFCGGIFATLQPLNVVQMGLCLAKGEGVKALFFLWPMLAFFAGFFLVGLIHKVYEQFAEMIWQKTALLISAVGFLVSGLLAQEIGTFSNVMLTIATGIAFRLCFCLDRPTKGMGKLLFTMIAVFLIGVAFGHSMINLLGGKAIWCCSLFLLTMHFMMSDYSKKN